MRPYITRSEEIMLLIKEYEWQKHNKLYSASIRTYYNIEDEIDIFELEILDRNLYKVSSLR